MRTLALLGILLTSVGCYPMQTEHALVVDSTTLKPVQGIHVWKKAIPFLGRGWPLPGPSEGISDVNGIVVLRIPRDQGLYESRVLSSAFVEEDIPPREIVRPTGIDEVYYVRRKQ